ncbi:MAG: hypothetical protein CM15mP103_11490 [Gammaproteobacteria bacterium]|nr:MAG: hypothetical protein CM15mP103_11490 [Gammaproteobacteria bacterium]
MSAHWHRVSTSSVNVGSATYSGIGFYDPGLFTDCAPGKRPLKPLLDEAIARASLSGELYQGVWEDVGTPERLMALNRRFPRIQPTSKLQAPATPEHRSRV